MSNKQIEVLSKKFELEREKFKGKRGKYSLKLKKKALKLILRGVHKDELAKSLQIHRITLNKWDRQLKNNSQKVAKKGLENLFSEVKIKEEKSKSVYYLQTPKGIKIEINDLNSMIHLVKGLEGWPA